MVAKRLFHFMVSMRRAAAATVAALALSACAQPTPPQEPAGTQSVPKFDGKPKMLAINGFNYTDLTISSFSVGASGGGNIFVSSPTSGGGSTSCCVVLYPGAALPRPVTIEWMRLVNGKDRWCKKTVQLTGPIPENPTAFGVHFMPDGEIQVEVTQGYPKLKLRLANHNDGHRKAEGNVIHDEEKAVCKDGR
ncbi:MAG: DUF3304 domain-containing protein [Rhizobacter sp.]|nr:DUF3304 domain-containing protein [Rhizobacter sp.]